MHPTLDLLSSSLASTLRLWRGTWGDQPATTPPQLLVLFDREDDGECRLVREALTALNLDAQIYPCPAGGKRFAARRKKLAPHTAEGPLLYDPNSNQTIASAQLIVPYLFTQYLGRPAPAALLPSSFNLVSAKLASLVRDPAGIQAHASKNPRQPLVLYSFESSPYSRPVRERLCALELPYHLINLGKLEWSDMGPAAMRLSVGPYQPVAGSKRAAMLQHYGKVQVPFLIDPNQKREMFESQAILRYLDKMYAK
jgi:hypothetical protein